MPTKRTPERGTPKNRRIAEEENESVNSRRSIASRRRDDDDDDERETSKTKKGWKTFAKEQENRTERMYPDFFLTEDSDSAIIQIISEPLILNAHSVQVRGNWATEICQTERQRHCLICRAGGKTSMKVAIKVLDFRGEYDSDKKKFKHNKQVEKVWLMSSSTAEALKTFIDKKDLDETNCIVAVSRTGSKKTTVYHFEIARDDEDVRMKPIRYTSILEDLHEIVIPKTDEQLERLGFTVG